MHKLKQILHTFPFIVPGDWQVSMEVNTIPDDVTAYSCDLVQIHPDRQPKWSPG